MKLQPLVHETASNKRQTSVTNQTLDDDDEKTTPFMHTHTSVSYFFYQKTIIVDWMTRFSQIKHKKSKIELKRKTNTGNTRQIFVKYLTVTQPVANLKV